MEKDNANTELADRLIKRHHSLSSQRGAWDSFCQEIANYVMPRKAEITERSETPSTTRQDRLFDSTAVRANQVLANGHLAWMTPMDSQWFSYNPPRMLRGVDTVEQWFRHCSEVAQEVLANSNFYSEIHELYLDRGAFGTGVLFCEEGRNGALTFSSFDIGTYSLAENAEGYVDTLFREFELTCRQAEEKFGRENLSAKLQAELKDCDGGKSGTDVDRKHKFLHAVYPRAASERAYGKTDGANKPYASTYIEMGNKHVAREGGFDELPFFATRYLKWGNSVYGWSPSWIALPEARQLNFLEKQMDALAEVKAFPRILLPDTHEGEVDMRASGVTYYDSQNPGAVPREWGTAGEYNVGKDRAEIKRAAINDAFHVDLFQMFSQIQKQMTAREVAERASEKLIQFSPTFARMSTELYGPLLQRVFSLLARQGQFPPPPQEMVSHSPMGVSIPNPEVTYNSRIALAIKQLSNSAFARSMEMIMPVVQARPDVLDNYDFDRIVRDIHRNDGVPADWLLPLQSVQDSRSARAQAQAAQAQHAQLLSGADAAAKIGSIPKDSAAVELLKNGGAAAQ